MVPLFLCRSEVTTSGCRTARLRLWGAMPGWHFLSHGHCSVWASAPLPLQWQDLTSWLGHHFNGVIIVGGICLWVSLVLLVRLWRQSMNLPLGLRLFWSLVLFVPFLGWLFYGGCFRPAPLTDTPLADHTPGDLE